MRYPCIKNAWNLFLKSLGGFADPRASSARCEQSFARLDVKGKLGLQEAHATANLTPLS